MGRVFLRAPRGDDCEEFLARVAASRLLHADWVDPPRDRESYRAWSQHGASERCAARLVCLRRSGEPVGVANLNEIERRGEPRARLGFYALAGHAGRGYVREGVSQLLALAFGPLALARLEAEVRPENERSLALLAALGFGREAAPARMLRVGGAWREHERWSLAAADWSARSARASRYTRDGPRRSAGAGPGGSP
jgi:ribosomal-protein-alanine N-acetyltransferase